MKQMTKYRTCIACKAKTTDYKKINGKIRCIPCSRLALAVAYPWVFTEDAVELGLMSAHADTGWRILGEGWV